MSYKRWVPALRKQARLLWYRVRRFPPFRPVYLASRPFTLSQLYTVWHAFWTQELGEHIAEHRKQWEFSFIAQALYERGLLAPGKLGYGFGVGKEPLCALFVKWGARVVGSDLGTAERKRLGWNDDDRSPALYLNEQDLCPPDTWAEGFVFQEQDMRQGEQFPQQSYDFCWSCGSLEHLGGIRHGEEFIRASLATLKPGGVAVHTTEFNLTSNDKTVRTGGTVVYRKADIEALAAELRENGHTVVLDWRGAEWPMSDYGQMGPHDADGYLTIDIKDYAVTSFGWIITKGVSA